MDKEVNPKKPINGVLLLDKSTGISSNGALQQVRRLFQAAKGGHTGVLDPLATGILPLCFGEATKFSADMFEADKSYRATVQFGGNTTTGDLEGEVILTRTRKFDSEDLHTALKAFIGKIDQVPPMYSALKYQGKPLYEYARQGITIERPARPITIYDINLIEFNPENGIAIIEVSCSKGTYVRTLAEDLGERLGCGAYLIGLRRTCVANFTDQESVTFAELEACSPAERLLFLKQPDILVSHLSSVMLGLDQTKQFCYGMPVPLQANYATMQRLRVYQINEASGSFLGIGEIDENNSLKPVRLIATN